MTKRMIGVVSDTHGWLDPQLLEVFDGAWRIVHAGDIGDEAVLDALGQVAPVVAVKGNIDGGPLRFLPLEATLQVGPCKLALRHIAGSPTRPNAATLALLERERPTALIVGHSHISVVARVRGALWLNPGAAGRQGFHDQRLAMRLFIDEESGELSLERVTLGSRADAF